MDPAPIPSLLNHVLCVMVSHNSVVTLCDLLSVSQIRVCPGSRSEEEL